MQEGLIDIGDVRLWHWDTGGEGAAIVLSHPASQSCQVWEHQRASFAEAGYRVIGYSRRGHDRSEPGPADRPGTTVGDLVALMDRLGIERAHVLGAAAGGITATGLAVAHPERVRSLMLIGTIVAPDEDDWRSLYGRLGMAELRGRVPETFLELGPSYRASQQEGTARFAALSEAGSPKGGGRQPIGVSVTWAALEAMRVPTLMVTGEADLYAPPPLQSLVAGHIAMRRVHTIRECGHAPYWETPDQFNGLVLDFLAAIERRG